MSALVESMAYFDAVPWHGLGVSVPEVARRDWKEFCTAAGLDWTVERKPIYSENEEIKSHKAIIRDNGDVLGVVGSKYVPIQNQTAFEFFDPMVQEGLALYHTAGSLRGGRHVWVLAQIGNLQKVQQNDEIGTFLMLTTGHDGSRSCWVTPTTIRVVCANTENAAMREANKNQTLMKVKHTGKAEENLSVIQQSIMPVIDNFDETIRMFRWMAQTQAKSTGVDKFLEELFPMGKEPTQRKETMVNKSRERIRDIFANGGVQGDTFNPSLRYNNWMLYQAVTQFVDWERGRTDDSRLHSAWFGAGSELKSKALSLLVA